MEREPRLPKERPPPTRAQAPTSKAQAHKNTRAKRHTKLFVQVLNDIDFLRTYGD